MTSKHKLPPILYSGGQDYPLFNRISIETTSYCNRVCPFCPISTGRRDFFTLMTDALYAKIIKELYELSWKGFIQLFLLNEPLLDKQLLRRAKLARTALHDSTIYISTNGDALDSKGRKGLDYAIEMWAGLYAAGVNSININIYDPGEEQALRYHAMVKRAVDSGLATYNGHKYQPKSVYHNWITLTDMRPERLTSSMTDMFYNRTNEERQGVTAPQMYCARTQRHLVILYNGQVPICCAADPTSEDTPTVGNITDQSIREVWNKELFYKYRYYTQQAMRVLPACSNCNHRMSYAYLVRKVDAPPEVKDRWATSLEAFQRRGFAQAPLVQLQGALGT